MRSLVLKLTNIFLNHFSSADNKNLIKICFLNKQLMYIDIYAYIYISWPILIEDDPKAPFSIATTLRCYGRRYFSPWIAPLTLDPYLKTSVKQGDIKYHFLSL